MQHPGGALLRAESAAACAFDINPNNHSIQHTQAEISRRLAKETDRSPSETSSETNHSGEARRGEQFGSQNTTYIPGHNWRLMNFRILQPPYNCPKMGLFPPLLSLPLVRRKLPFNGALQLFPESSELLTVESTFRECLDQSGPALEALERAFKLNPRQDWLAVRLARKYQTSGDLPKSKGVLEVCLRDNPSSKLAHLHLGLLLTHLGDTNGAIEHLRRSFSHGDNNHEAQFWFARELFLQNQFPESEELFRVINDRAPGRFRTKSGANVQRNGSLVFFECRVERKEEGYAFLKLSQFPKNVLCISWG